MSKPSIGSENKPIEHLWVENLHTDKDFIPVGTILAFAGNGSSIPVGYLLCNGAEVSRSMFPDLFDIIGETYGSGDSSTTFNLPDANQAKRFLQGNTVAGNVVPFGATGSDYSALTTRYIIKAFDGQTADSALIDITRYANELAAKADCDLGNLTTAGEDRFNSKANVNLNNLTTEGINVIKQNSGGTPTGTILAYASNGALPDGYLSCDGSSISRTTYADLFAVIGTTWGSGDGSTTFSLPYLNGYWLKGSSTAGSSISAGLPNITGAISQFRSHGSASKSGAFSGSVAGTVSMGNYGNTSSSNNYINISFSAANSNSLYGSSSTVSVSSKTVRFIIKY